MERLIVVNSNDNRIEYVPLFDYIKKLYNFGYRFKVCHVTDEEFISMEKQIAKGKLYEIEPRVGRGGEYNQSRTLMNYGNDGDYIAITDYDSEENEGKYLLSNKELIYVLNGVETFDNKGIYKDNSIIKIYTTATYREVLNNYIINTKVKKDIKKEDLARSILEVEKLMLFFREKKYDLLGLEQESLEMKK